MQIIRVYIDIGPCGNHTSQWSILLWQPYFYEKVLCRILHTYIHSLIYMFKTQPIFFIILLTLLIKLKSYLAPWSLKIQIGQMNVSRAFICFFNISLGYLFSRALSFFILNFINRYLSNLSIQIDVRSKHLLTLFNRVGF